MRKEYTMPVAGTNHYQPALSSLMDDENIDYTLSKADLVDEFDEDDRIYKYEIGEFPFALQHEPDNPFDPAALKVFADGIHVGYIPKGNLSVLKKLSMLPDLKMTVRVYGGPYKFLEYDTEEDFYGEMLPKYYKVKTSRDPFRAVIIFSYQA